MISNWKAQGAFTNEDLSILKRFRRPHDIQDFLNSISYDEMPGTSSPRIVMEEGKANCFEGSLFAAAALRSIGRRPLIVDMIAQNDDDHVIALFMEGKYYGAVAKSNTTMLRYRDPVFRSIRELAMSYFPFYFNIKGEMTLRSFSNPVDLSRFDGRGWVTTDENLDYIGDYLNTVRHHEVLDHRMRKHVSRADDDIVKMCFSGAITEGVYKPE